MLKAVVDTNVIVSGTIRSRGNPFEILETWRQSKFVLLISPEIVSEVEAVLRRPRIFKKYRLTEEQLTQLLKALNEEAEVVIPGPIGPLPGIGRSDLRFLACAEAGEADYLVTGDQALLNLKRHKGTRIVPPRAFIAILHATP